MILAAIVATFLNPYGPNLHKWLLTALSVSRPEITEWNPLDPWSVAAIPYLLLIAAFVAAAIFSRRTRDFTYLAVIGAVLVQAIQHERHIAIFAILFGFWMPIHVQSLLERLSPSAAGEPNTDEPNTEHAESAAEPDGLATASPAVRWGFAIAARDRRPAACWTAGWADRRYAGPAQRVAGLGLPVHGRPRPEGEDCLHLQLGPVRDRGLWPGGTTSGRRAAVSFRRPLLHLLSASDHRRAFRLGPGDGRAARPLPQPEVARVRRRASARHEQSRPGTRLPPPTAQHAR